jgi:hypothetical protein
VVDQRRAAHANRKALAAAIREFTGRKYDYTPRNAFEERYVHYVSTIEAERIAIR